MTDNAVKKPAYGELAKAIGQNDASAVKALLRCGADVNETEPKWGRDMLTLAADRGYVEIARLLIDAGADVNKVWRAGMTPLMRAAIAGRKEVIRLLIAHGAAVDATSDKGWTAVRHSINERKPDVLWVLIENGADVTIADKEGVTPQRIAEIHGYAQIVNMLKEAPARQQHDLAVKNQRRLKGRVSKPVIVRGPKP